VDRLDAVPRSVRGSVERAFAGREWSAAMPGVWQTPSATWVNPMGASLAASDKLGQLRHAAALGFSVPRTLVTNDPVEAQAFCAAAAGSVLAKPLHSHGLRRRGQRFGVFSQRLEARHLDLLDSLPSSPCIFQQYVDKRVEVRVTVVGKQIFAAEIHSQDVERARVDFRRATGAVPVLAHDLPAEVAERCRRLTALLGLAYAALDLILTPAGEYVFLELNERGTWRFIEERTGLRITAAVADLLLETAWSDQRNRTATVAAR
jgi:glutathione synthase/RimK-type ligase-like ATP-grasp enzyme